MVAFIEWSKDLSVKIQDIDLQHQKLISLINDLSQCIEDGMDENCIVLTFEEVANYVQRHFALEEQYFRKFNYPGYGRHKNEHDFFAREIMHKFQKYQVKQSDIAAELLEFLKSWFIHHIKQEDMRYKPFFEDKGIR